MTLKPLLDSNTLAETMGEMVPAYSAHQAKVEADRCLYCFDAPCITACPTGIDVPAFIKKIANENTGGAGRVILESNILGGSCARVCPTSDLCEGACVMLDRDELPIQIGRLQRHATDYVHENKLSVLEKPTTRLGKSVGLIGSGPASMGCAAELARLGYDTVVYEKQPEAGGLNTYGIAYYKLTPQVSLEEVELIKNLGVEFKTGIEVGKDLSMDDLQKNHDAVFIGVGLGSARRLEIPGEDLTGVCEALDFIEEFHKKPLYEVGVGKHVVIIGCGNTAIDAVTQAKRMGAKTATIVYRRGESEMSAYDFEYELAKKDGCSFIFDASPIEVLGDSEVNGLKLISTEIVDGRPVPIAGSDYTIPCDMLIKASGQLARRKLLESIAPGISLSSSGHISIDKATGATSLPKIFAGGDAANGGKEVVNAVAEGKKAARGIHESLGGDPVEGPIQPTRLGIKGKPIGSGFDNPVRVSELETAYYKTQKEN